jgi:hypothetical protein
MLSAMFKVSDCGHEKLHLTLKSSKTDQRLKSVTLIIRRQVDKLICPKGLYKPHSFKIILQGQLLSPRSSKGISPSPMYY